MRVMEWPIVSETCDLCSVCVRLSELVLSLSVIAVQFLSRPVSRVFFYTMKVMFESRFQILLACGLKSTLIIVYASKTVFKYFSPSIKVRSMKVKADVWAAITVCCLGVSLYWQIFFCFLLLLYIIFWFVSVLFRFNNIPNKKYNYLKTTFEMHFGLKRKYGLKRNEQELI